MRFVHFDTLDSTNSEAKRRAENGDRGPVWISADAQSLGKGRRGREWVSETGNLFCTGLYPHTDDPTTVARLSFAAALAVADALSAYIDPSSVQIKWPNDVLVNGHKISGILLENGSTKDEKWIAIGIGINLISCPQIEGYKTAYLLAHIVPEKLDCAEPLFTGAQPVLAILAQSFDTWRELYIKQGFAPLRKAWLARAQGIGGEVTVRLPNKTIEGIALGMDMDGALEVRASMGDDAGKILKIHAGDVFFSG